MKLKGIFAVSVVCLVGFASAPQPSQAQISQQGNKYLFRYKWEKGKTYNYNISYTMTMPAAAGGARGANAGARPQTMSSRFSMRVIDVKNGVATIEMVMPAVGGQQAPPPQRMQIDSRGNPVGGGRNMAAQNTPALPAAAVSIGQTWKNTMQVPGMAGGPMTMESTSRLKGVTGSGARRSAEVTQSMTLKGSGLTGSGSGTYMHDMADGMVRTGRISMNMTMQAPARQGQPKPQPMKIPMTVTITRQ